MGKPNRKKKKILWNQESEELLCKMWQKRYPEMHGSRKNTHIYKQMSAQMLEKGLHFTPDELHVKMNNLRAKYKKERVLMSSSEGGTTDWPLYYKVHDIVGPYMGNNSEFQTEESISEDYSLHGKHYDSFISTKSEVDSDTDSPMNETTENRIHQNIASSSSVSSPDWFQIQVLSGLQKTNERLDREAEERQAETRSSQLFHERQQTVNDKILATLTQMAEDSRNFHKSLLLALTKNK